MFLDGDEFSRSDRAWYACILQTSRDLLCAGLAAVEQTGIVVVAYPLACTNWIDFKRSFEDRGVRTAYVSLRASYASIVDKNGGRIFSPEEQRRIQRMIDEGYGARPFSGLIVDTDVADRDRTLAVLEQGIRRIIDF